MVYALVELGSVTKVECRMTTVPYTDSLMPLIEARFYPPEEIPYFKPVPRALWCKIRRGWQYDDVKGFYNPGE